MASEFPDIPHNMAEGPLALRTVAHPPPQRFVASTWAAGEPQVRESRSITRASQTWKVG
jgi:hypothetical protein